MSSEKTKTINLIQELNTPIEEHEINLTENQLKVIKTKYLRDDPSPKFWLSNVAKNIALSELIHKDKFLKKVLDGVGHVIKEYDVYGKKEKIVLFHNGIEEYSERCKNFDKFVKNLNSIAETDSEAKQIVNEMHVQFYNLLANFYFLPNSPTLMNASRDLQQLSACFKGDQPIMTADGIKSIIEIKKGDKVLTGKGNFKKVIRTMERLAESYRIINIWKMPNETLSVSDEHPILCLNKNTNNTVWKFAADITTEDYVAISYPKKTIDLSKLNLLDFITKNKDNYKINDGYIYKTNKDKRCPKYIAQIKPVKSEVEVDYDLMKIFGYYLSEGDIDEGDSVRFTFNCLETEYMNDLISLVEKKFGLKSKIVKSNSGNWSNVKVHSVILTQVFYSLFGKGFNKKFIPNWVLELPVEKQKGLLVGIIRGDGYPVRNKNNTNIRTSLCNANLVYGVWVIFARMGILGNFKKDKIPSLGTVNPYKCVIDSFNSEKVFDEIFINKQFNGISQLSMRRVKELLINGTFFLPVKDINIIYEQTKVYNFEVEDEHTYVANNITVHNCFVLPIEDSIEGWMKAASAAAVIHKSGGGTGFSASRIRPSGAMVKSTKGVASGPLSPLKIIDEMTNQVKQGGCVSLDTRVSTENGLIKIGEIVPKLLINNSWASHKNGLLTVMTDSGPKISDEVYNNGLSEVITLKTSKGYSVTATPEHRFRIIDKEGNYVWKHLKDVKENDWLALQLDSYPESTEYNFPEFNYKPHANAEIITTPTIPTIGLAEIIGYFIGDGSISISEHGTGRFILSFGDDEQDVKEYLHRLMLSTFGILPVEEKKENDNSTNSFYNRTILVHWFKNLGVEKDSALTADVPEIVFKAGREFAKGFLRGLFTADGTITEEGYISLASVSEKLIDNTQQLLLSLGMPSLKSVTINRESSYGKNPLYHLRIITERGIKEFSENIKFLSEKKNKRFKTKDIKWEFNDIIPNQENKLKAIYDSPGRGCAPGKISKGANRKLYRNIQHYLPNVNAKRNLTYKRLKLLAEKHPEIKKSDLSWFLDNNQFYDQVKSLTNGITHTVDLSVPENNTYIANGFVSHNTRRGANMGILHCTHPNIREFIKCKTQKNFLENFNISVAITKEFMNAVENNSNYDLVDPHTKKVVEKVNAKEIFDMMVNNAWETGDPGFVVIDRINETNSNPTPHVGMIESTNPCVTGDSLVSTEYGLIRMKELVEKYPDGGIKIIADNRVPIKVKNSDGTIMLLENKEKGISYNFMSKAFSTGVKEVYKLETESGYEIKCTADHKIFTNEGFVPLSDLDTSRHLVYIQSGEGCFNSDYKLPFDVKNNFKGNNGRKYNLNLPNKWSKELGQTLGWLIGDGWLRDKDKNCRVGFTFGNEDKPVLNYLKHILNNYYGYEIKDVKRKETVIHLSYHSKYFVDFFKKLGVLPVYSEEKVVPELLYQAPKEAVVGFLQGLFTADGTAARQEVNNTNYIRLTSKSIRLLKGVQNLLLNLGIKSRIYNRSRGERICFTYTTITGKLKEYKSDGKLFELQISKENINRFIDEIGFLFDKQKININKFREVDFHKEIFEEKIKLIIALGKEQVYDLTEPTTHSFCCNSIVISNCGEQPLLSFEPCNLGSINLSKFVKNINGSHIIDYESLGRITRLGTRFLDNVIDINNYPLSEIEEIAKTNRRIGLGVMGWAEMLVQLGIPYNSSEAYKIAEEVMSFINETSLTTSEELAKERGLFINFPDSIYDENGKNFRNFAAKPRNCARTTIAPTGTIAITAGLQGSGIEPFFAVVYVRYDAQGIDALKAGKSPPKEHTFFEVNPYFENVAKENNYFGLNKESLWKKIVEHHGSVQDLEEVPESIKKLFLTSHDLKPLDHVKIQVAFQKFTDNAVSKTINLKQEATPDDIRECYILAYKHGCKGVTIYRDGSKSEQVLNLTKKEEKKEPQVIQPQIEKTKIVEGNKGELSSYYQIETGQGPLHIHINYDNIKGPKKVFVNLTPIGTEISGMATALGILISKYLDLGGDPIRIIKHLNSIKSDKPFGFGPKRVDSVAHGIAIALRDHLVKTDKLKETQVTIGDFSHGNINPSTGTKENLYCPKCFSANVAVIGGCTKPTCFDCGFSECS